MSGDLSRRDPYEITVRPVRDARQAIDHDPDAARRGVGAVLVDDRGLLVWERVSAIVEARDFAIQVHVDIFNAMSAIVARGVPLDVTTVCAELRAMNRINAVGGAQALGELPDAVVTPAHVETHARMVQEHSARRQVVTIIRALGAKVLSGAQLGPLLAAALGALESVPLPSVEAPTMADDVDAYFQQLEGRAPPSTAPVPLGLADLDFALHGGLRMGSYLLLGLPATGKTTLAVQRAAHVALTTGWVLFVSKEVNRGDLRDALLAHLAHLPLSRVVHARENPHAPALTADDLAALTHAASVLHRMRLRVTDPTTPGCPSTVAEVVAMARGMRPAPVLIVIDNLGELTARGQHGTRTDLATEEKMKDLRRAKNLLKIPILTLAHPTSAARSGARPRRIAEGDIAGGQASTRVCDGVLLMHREDKHPTRDHSKDPPTPECVEIYSGKVRGVSKPIYVEAIARINEHRFVSRQTRDADVWTQDNFSPRVSMVHERSHGPVSASDGAAIYAAAGDLPDDGAPASRGESGRLALADEGPQWTDGDDGARGAG